MNAGRSSRMNRAGRALQALCGVLIAAGALGHSLLGGAREQGDRDSDAGT